MEEDLRISKKRCYVQMDVMRFHNVPFAHHQTQFETLLSKTLKKDIVNRLDVYGVYFLLIIPMKEEVVEGIKVIEKWTSINRENQLGLNIINRCLTFGSTDCVRDKKDIQILERLGWRGEPGNKWSIYFN